MGGLNVGETQELSGRFSLQAKIGLMAMGFDTETSQKVSWVFPGLGRALRGETSGPSEDYYCSKPSGLGLESSKAKIVFRQRAIGPMCSRERPGGVL